MTVEIHMLSQSQPVTRERVTNAYTKDGLYCVLLADGAVEKYPLVNVFRVVERSA